MKSYLLLLFFLLLGVTGAYAQGAGGPRPPEVTNAPIDGGASLLLAAGAAYGLRRLRSRRAR